MDKKKIIISLSIVTLLTMSSFYNAEKVNAGKGMCTYKAVFYYNEGIDPSHTGTGTTINNTSWTIGSGTSAGEISNVSYEARDMTAQDCVNYVSNFGYKSSSSYNNSCTEEADHSITCGNEHINNGSYETGKVETGGVKDMISDLGGGDIAEGCKIFTNNTIKANSIDVKQNGINEENGKPQDQITREYDYDTGVAMTNRAGKTYKFSVQTIIKTWTAPCETEDKEIKKECTCANSGGGGSSLTTCGGTITNSKTDCATGSFTGTSSNTNTCKANPTITWSVKVKTTERITVSVNIAPQTIYAGGGVGIKINQNSSTSSAIEGICITTDETIPKCNDGGTLSASTSSSSGFKCTKRNCSWVTNEETGELERECTTETYNATCVATQGISPGDSAKAEAEARKAAAKFGSGSSTPKEITVFARQSNDEKDTKYYNLSKDESGQGIAISSIKNSNETTIEDPTTLRENSMGTGRVMQSSVNQACINRKTGIVRYITSGNCNDDEVDGGHKYYIPLKLASGNFIFKLNSDNISSISTSPVNANCVVNVNQKLYGNDGKYKFIYRPVDLLTDPHTSVFPKRQPATNWVNFKNTENSSKTGAYDQAMKRDKLEYSATLDAAAIQNIKNRNKEYLANNNYYNSFGTISNEGRSTVLEALGVTRGLTSRYNKLGECNKKTTTITDGAISDNSTSILQGTECW